MQAGLGGLGSSGVVGGGSLVVGLVVGFSARWVMWPSQVVVVLVYRGFWAAGVGSWAVVVVAGVLLGVVVKRYPEPMAHGPEACEPSHPLWPMARRPVIRHTRAEAVDTGCQRDIPVL